MKGSVFGMWILRSAFFLFLCVSLFSFDGSRAEAAIKSTEALDAFLASIRQMEFPVTDQARHATFLAQTNQYLDLDSMGKASLEEHWEESTKEEQDSFLFLLWRLIEVVAYPGSQDFLGTYQITYPEVKHTADGDWVTSLVEQSEEAFTAEVIYHLYLVGEQWKIDDIILDGVSMIEDLSYQFKKIIETSSFSGLLTKMQDKLDEINQTSEE